MDQSYQIIASPRQWTCPVIQNQWVIEAWKSDAGPRQSDERCLIDRTANDCWICISAVRLERNLNYSCHSVLGDLFQNLQVRRETKKCCMTRKNPRCDDLNSLTGVSLRCCRFYTGDKHLRDETLVARSFCVCVCARLCWPLLTQRSLYDVPLQGHFDAKLWQVHISATFCINSPARIRVTTARREYQCLACQTKQRRASGMMADVTWCQYNSASNWYHNFCSSREEA